MSNVYLPDVSVGILQSREEFIEKCLNSVYGQVYPKPIKDIIVLENFDDQYTIGEGYNEIARRAKHDWILYLGDDDFISRDYVLSLMLRLSNTMQLVDNVVAVSSYCRIFNNENLDQEQAYEKIVSAIWSKEYILEHGWDEEKENGVDTEMYYRANRNGYSIALNDWNYGYYYRQHDSNVSGNVFERKKRKHEGEGIEIYGHKRSGNHYLSVLIDRNFTQTGNPLNLLRGHGFIQNLQLDVKYLYIDRNFDDVARSLYKYRDRQSLRADSFEKFLNTNYSEMYDPEINCDVDYNMGSKEANEYADANFSGQGTVDYFKDIQMTPKEFWEFHRSHFYRLDEAFNNLMIVRYEDLVERFGPTMMAIAEFLGYESMDNFEDVDERVGWFPKQEQWNKTAVL